MILDHKLFEGKKIAIVANRPPITPVQIGDSTVIKRGIGGLVAALEPVIERFNGIWFCTTTEPCKLKNILTLPYNVKTLELEEKEYKEYNEGYANKQLWPIFHYFPSRCIFNDNDWNVYKSVNEKMAKLISENVSDDTYIWVHDYHFLLLPEMLRRINPNYKIGFFLHIPFPNQEVFRLLSNRTELLNGVLGADYIGFHTSGYVEHFVNCVKLLIPESEVSGSDFTIKLGSRKIKCAVNPISIDFDCITQKAKEESIVEKIDSLQAGYKSEIIGISVDRLDYTKGTVERLIAIENFLEKYPEYLNKITFIQISVPTRTEIETYQILKKEVDETVGRINGKFSKDGWRPVFYIYGTLSFDELVSYYALSDFALVVPLRDGMNLVSKEYIASKINNNGVLILSEFAGAGEEMKEALLVNPYQSGLVADAIKKAIEMPEREKLNRMQLLREKVKSNDVYSWVNKFFVGFNEATKTLTRAH